MASLVSASTSELPQQEGLYRFVHPNNANEDGTLNSGAFNFRRDPELSVGIESIVQSISFARFCDLKPHQGVARVGVGQVMDLGLSVTPLAELEWGEFANAHAVLAGYAAWPKQKREEIARRLRDLANQQILKPVPR